MGKEANRYLLLSRYPMPTSVRAALELAAHSHRSQKRKYDGAPYIVHPIDVRNRLVSVMTGRVNGAMLNIMQQAALLHDVLEDTDCPEADIEKIDAETLRLVLELTDVSRPSDGNRAKRVAIDLAHFRKASSAAQTIRMFDISDNIDGIVDRDPDFAPKYLSEKRAVIAAASRAHPAAVAYVDKIHAREVEALRFLGKEPLCSRPASAEPNPTLSNAP
ncbi:MAG: HD domain-containing protein [Azospirillum sp.]|nr:HD domain-containing protein [Azospirillum sp.]